MRYAVNYNANFRYFDQVDEVVFDYKGSESIVDFIPKILKRQEQKAIINLCEIENIKEIIPYLNKLKQVHVNIMVQIDYIKQRDIIELLKDNKIDFMFKNFAKDYDTFYSMVQLGAEDITVVEYLGFCLDNLQEMRNKYGISIRVIPDIAQSAAGTGRIIPPITKFWIRPEDTELYEPYVDVFQILRNDDRQSVIFEIYKRQQWLGNIQDIIMDLDVDIQNDNINPRFGLMRLDCNKKCMYGKCNLCMEIQDLALRFNLAEITIQKKSKKFITQEEKEKIQADLDKRKEKINESTTD